MSGATEILKYKLSRKALVRLYNTMVRLILEYGYVIYANCTGGLAHYLEANQAARNCTGALHHTFQFLFCCLIRLADFRSSSHLSKTNHGHVWVNPGRYITPYNIELAYATEYVFKFLRQFYQLLLENTLSYGSVHSTVFQ